MHYRKNILSAFVLVGFAILALGTFHDPPRPQQPLAPPTEVTAKPGDSLVVIRWNAVNDATSYNLYMAAEHGVTAQNYGTLAESMRHMDLFFSPYIHRGLTNGTTYYFVVTAVNAAGESAESSEVSATATTTTPTILPTDSPPVANDKMVSTAEDTAVAITLSGSDVETAPANLSWTVRAPVHGKLSGIAPNLTYMPDADFNGADTFTYTVTDRGNPDNCGAPGPSCAEPQTSDLATVTITVNLPCLDGSLVKVPAFSADLFTPTGIQVQEGDRITITASRKASRQWSVGAGFIGPDGDNTRSCAGCPVNAPLGALIGRIGKNGDPPAYCGASGASCFLVGSQATIAAKESSELFLTSNDNAVGTCYGHISGSCYFDNKGTQQACVTIEQGPVMTSEWDETGGTLRILRDGQLVVVYQRDTQPGIRSIGNAITELYAPRAVSAPDYNLLADVSPLVPPQILVGVQDTFISDVCSNNPADTACDYFAHHSPTVEILQASGSAVKFRVQATSTQHNDFGTPLAYASDMTVTVPSHPMHTVVEYDVKTNLNQSANVRHALRPFPFYELVNHPYGNVSYLGINCQNVVTVPIPTSGSPFLTFLPPSPVCNNRPWTAIHHNAKGNLGMILQLWNWSSGGPALVSFTETVNHPGEPNLYFQSTDHSRLYSSGTWEGRIVFLAYNNAADYMPVKQFRDILAQ